MATYQQQLDKLRLQREAKERAEAASEAAQLSPDQVAHWRLVLANMGIPFAMSMPVDMVQRFRDGLQARVNAEYPSPAASHADNEEK